jgi:hypothetical protein
VALLLLGRRPRDLNPPPGSSSPFFFSLCVWVLWAFWLGWILSGFKCSEGLPGQAGKGGWVGGINSKEGEQVVVCIS